MLPKAREACVIKVIEGTIGRFCSSKHVQCGITKHSKTQPLRIVAHSATLQENLEVHQTHGFQKENWLHRSLLSIRNPFMGLGEFVFTETLHVLSNM